MSELRPDDPTDRDLWRKVRCTGRRRAASEDACPDATDLAAYVDRKVRGERLARIEAHLASCDHCLQAVGEARELLSQPAKLAPAQVLIRAKALVAAESERSANAKPPAWRKVGGWLGLRGDEGRWKTALRWTAAAAAGVLVGFAGFFAGSATYRSRQATDARLAGEVSFDLAGDIEGNSLLLDHDLELLLATQGGAR